jgi:hypothetical protein
VAVERTLFVVVWMDCHSVERNEILIVGVTRIVAFFVVDFDMLVVVVDVVVDSV